MEVLTFARPADPELAIVRVLDLLRDTREFLAPSLKDSGVNLLLGEAPDSCVTVDRNQMKQVLINLIHNAAEASGPGSTTHICAHRQQARLAGRLTPVVGIEVRDRGKGIAPDVEKRLFDPFFTTKPSGTGLGLAIASRMVEQHGGALQYQTQVGHGTTFGVVLPEVDASKSVVPSSQGLEASSNHR